MSSRALPQKHTHKYPARLQRDRGSWGKSTGWKAVGERSVQWLLEALGTYNLTTSYIVCLCLDIFVVDETIRCYCCTRYSAAVDNIGVHSYRMMGEWYTCLPTYAEGAIDILSNLQGDGHIKYLSIWGHVISNIRTAPNRLV